MKISKSTFQIYLKTRLPNPHSKTQTKKLCLSLCSKIGATNIISKLYLTVISIYHTALSSISISKVSTSTKLQHLSKSQLTSQLLRNFSISQSLISSISQTRSLSISLSIFSISSFNVSSSSTSLQHSSKNLSLFSIFLIYKQHSVCYNITIEHYLCKKRR